MRRQFQPHLEILPDPQRQLWSDLRPAQTFGMALYGGTAIALRLGHRVSVDFDFFTDRPLPRERLLATLPFLDRAQVLQDQPDTLTVFVPGSRAGEAVNVSFFGGISFGRIGEPDLTPDGVVQVASLTDLLATKLKVLLQRIEAKDYLDIAAILRDGVPLEQGLAGAVALYGPAFQPSESLKALTYFEGGDLDSLPSDVRDELVRAARDVRDLPPIEVIARSLTADYPEP